MIRKLFFFCERDREGDDRKESVTTWCGGRRLAQGKSGRERMRTLVKPDDRGALFRCRSITRPNKNNRYS